MAVLIAVLVAPGTAWAARTTMSPQQCEAQHHGSGNVLLPCCPDEAPSPASITERHETSGSRLDLVKIGGSAPATVAAAFSAPRTASALRVYSPPHGQRSVDLQILHATFLI